MSDNTHNRDSDEDAVLNQLIRASRETESADGFVRPAEEAISAYLLGTATEEQRKAVRSALARSKQFRREILNMARDMEALADLDLTVYEQEAGQIPVPEGIVVEPTPVSSWTRAKESWKGLKDFWAKLWELKIPQVYAPAVVVVALVIRFGIFPPGGVEPMLGQWALSSEHLVHERLIWNGAKRGVESEKHYPDPEEAALAKIRFLLEYKDGQFHLRAPEEKLEPPSRSKSVVLRVLDSQNRLIEEFQVEVPIIDAEPVTAWALGLPARNLYRLNVKSDIMEVMWTEDMGPYGCVTLTYRALEGYQAVAGFTLDLR